MDKTGDTTSNSASTTGSPDATSSSPAGVPAALGSPFGQTPTDPAAEEDKAKTDRELADREQAQADADRDELAAFRAQRDASAVTLAPAPADVPTGDPAAAEQQKATDAAVAQAAGAPTEPQAVKGPDDVHRLTVGEGESLDYIADRENVNASSLYRANQGAIEAAAQARGFGGSDNGRLLFPGTLLDLP